MPIRRGTLQPSQLIAQRTRYLTGRALLCSFQRALWRPTAPSSDEVHQGDADGFQTSDGVGQGLVEEFSRGAHRVLEET